MAVVARAPHLSRGGALRTRRCPAWHGDGPVDGGRHGESASATETSDVRVRPTLCGALRTRTADTDSLLDASCAARRLPSHFRRRSRLGRGQPGPARRAGPAAALPCHGFEPGFWRLAAARPRPVRPGLWRSCSPPGVRWLLPPRQCRPR
jgi:hypothetical protein